MKQPKKAIEDIYQKMSPIEHILKRPDTYIGSTSRQTDSMWVWDEGTDSMQFKSIEFVPGLFKIFDEVLVNATDNYQRDHSMNNLKVNINPEVHNYFNNQKNNSISVYNNGQPIPVQIHKDHGMYVPELIFGVLLTGSNYDDSEKRVVGGRNGYGAKLSNVYSKKFVVEVQDSTSQKLYLQTWTNNMSNKTIPEVKSTKSMENYVQVTFYPDLIRFGMQKLEDDIVALMKKRVYDMAGIFGGRIKVTLNGTLLKINSFMKYVDLYLSDKVETIKIYDKDMTTPRWEVLVTYSPTQFQQVSFVNSICTSKGGTHVNYVTDKIVGEIQNELTNNKKYKGIEVQKYQIKQCIWVFINCLIDNPSFDSQTKENMTTKVSDFGGDTCERFRVTEKFSKALLKTDILEAIVSQARAKQNTKMNKNMKGVKTARLFGIEKLDDANEAGRKYSEQCTLILTEGDSAKSLVMAAIDVIGRDRYGVYPLRGKLLNVRDASVQQIMNNTEIQNIIKIMGLQKDRHYEDLKSLRYGSIMFMADQDTDGSHIKGLLMNFIHHFWPSLCQVKGFLTEFVTPIIKVSKGINQQIQFFTIQDFNHWQEVQGAESKLWHTKYYKGLGTSDDIEAKEYFSNLLRHRIVFQYVNEDDDKSIDLCFNKKKANERKEWLNCYNSDLFVDHNIKELSYQDFINKELIHFSMYDNIRSIPSLVDGLKPGQRKVLFCCFKRNLKQELKVVQLGGYVAEHSAYHHGEASLSETIIGMAQNFPGSNNINLLLPKGQFGSRLIGGKDHASARYIHTMLSKLTRAIFPEADDHSLTYNEDDGHIVEPHFYVPVLPMSLVNGAEGIGTGWSTNVPNYNARELVTQIRRRLDGHEFTMVHPFYRGWVGEIVPAEGNNYTARGLWDYDQESCILKIKELPIKKWTKDYKEWLEKMVEDETSFITDYREYHTKHSVHFEVQLNQAVAFEKVFKLSTNIATSNMVLFNSEGRLHRYSNVTEIMEEHYQLRLGFYDKRKQYLASKIGREIQITSNKVRFILCVLSEEINLRNAKKLDLCRQLVIMKFIRQVDLMRVKSNKLSAFGEVQKTKNVKESDGSSSEEKVKKNKTQPIDNELSEYNYLLTMPLLSLTYEKVERLKADLQEKEIAMELLMKTHLKQMWNDDLNVLERLLDELEDDDKKAQSKQVNKLQGKAMKKPKEPKKNDQNEKGKKVDEEQKNKKIKVLNKEELKKPKKNIGSQQRKKLHSDEESDGATTLFTVIPKIAKVTIQEEHNSNDYQPSRQKNKRNLMDSDDDDDFHP